jgi:OmpA-OmpF porin, OOP family
MRNFLLYLLLILSPGFIISAQSWRSMTWEVHLGIGSAKYFGDIGGTPHENNWYGIRDLDILRTRPSAVGGIRYNQNRYISFNTTAALGWLSGSDAGGKNHSRDYIFNTVIFEPTARLEFFPLRDLQIGSGVDSRGLVRNYVTLSAYIFAGAGAVIYHVNPNENLRARQERDNLFYSPVTAVIPAGIGVKIGIRNFIDLGIEIGGRYAFTDFLDGFTSPTSTANDIYYISSLVLVYRIRNVDFVPGVD